MEFICDGVMSEAGAPSRGPATAAGLRVGLAVAQWRSAITEALLVGAKRSVAEAGAPDPTVVWVPGVFEVPVAARALAKQHDVVVALGVVIRGDTPHFDYLWQAAALGLMQISTHTGTPVGFGVLFCDDESQARQWAGLPGSSEDNGYAVATAALATAVNLRDLERRAGDLQATASPCRLAGIVVHGDKRGRGLGFPTANIFRNPNCRIPADGVYAGWLTRPGGRPMPALVSVGANITFDGTEHRIEAHAIDHVDLDLYGHRVELDLVHRLRDMRRCRDDEELVALMGHDVEQVRALLAETSTIPATTGNPHGG